jgi:hypothetical protein
MRVNVSIIRRQFETFRTFDNMTPAVPWPPETPVKWRKRFRADHVTAAVGQPAVAPVNTKDLNLIRSVNMKNQVSIAESCDFLLFYVSFPMSAQSNSSG